MVAKFKRHLGSLTSTQRSWIWKVALTIIMVLIGRFALNTPWLTIIIVIALFASKEAYDYRRKIANANAPWK
jgi:uncharacterized membrane protein HdeD (DUF308 family)